MPWFDAARQAIHELMETPDEQLGATESREAGPLELERLVRLPVLVAMAGLVGAVAGLGAYVFRAMIGLVHNLSFRGEIGLLYTATDPTPPSPWGVAVVAAPIVGAIGVVFLVQRFAPEAKGHGVPEVMEAIHYQGAVIRPIVALVKAVASSISIGTGGAVGREGPIIQIGAAFGSTFGQRVGAGLSDRQVLVAAGSAAGIAATFDAPLGGVLFAIELLLISVSARTILAVASAVASAMTVSRPLLDETLAFDIPALHQVLPLELNIIDVAGLLVLGVLIGKTSVLLIRSIYGLEDRFTQWFANPYTRHIVGMTIVGFMMYGFLQWRGQYVIEGVSYATVQEILRSAISDPWLLLVFAGAKVIATSLTLGSGASGGVFSPSLFVGAAIGAALGNAAMVCGLAVDPAVFALAGMAAMIAGSTGAVMTGIVMVAEMTGDYAIAVHLLIAAAVATAVRKWLSSGSIYTEKLYRRGHWVPEGLEVLGSEGIRAEDLMEALPADPSAVPRRIIPADAPVAVVLETLRTGRGAATVVGPEGRHVGIIRREHLTASLSGRRRHPPE